MNVMRLRYNDAENKVVFVFVTDDAHWVRRNFAHKEDVVLADDFEDPGKDDDPKIFDLVTLALCDHTIIG